MGEVHKGSSRMKRGRWYIFEWADGYRDTGMYHQCKKDDNQCARVLYLHKRWYGEPENQRGTPAWRCTGCYKKPVSSIVTLYTLSNWDSVCKQIQYE